MLLKYLDTPARVLSLSIQDLLGYTIPFLLGALFDSLLFIPLMGLISIYMLKRVLKHLPKFYVMRYVYWAFPTSKYNKILRVTLPSSSKRFLVK